MHEHLNGLRVERRDDNDNVEAAVVVTQWEDGQPGDDVIVLSDVHLQDDEALELDLAAIVLSAVCAYLNLGGNYDGLVNLIAVFKDIAATANRPAITPHHVLDLGHRVIYADTYDGELVRIIDGRCTDYITEGQMFVELEHGCVSLPGELYSDDDDDGD